MFRLAIFALVMIVALPVSAMAAVWQVRPAESSITITATQQGADFPAQFKKFQTEIKFDPADLAHSSVVATIDTSSFDSQSQDRDAQVKTSDWFDVAKFPVARFETKSFKDLGGGKYEAAAKLTIRGVTKDVTFPFSLTIKGKVAKMTGSLTLLRTDYGVGQGSWAATDWVGGNVKVNVALTADAS